MSDFKVSLEIDIEANSPLEAVLILEDWFLNRNGEGYQYYVQNNETGEIFSVDTDEEDDDAVLPVDHYEPFIKNRQ